MSIASEIGHTMVDFWAGYEDGKAHRTYDPVWRNTVEYRAGWDRGRWDGNPRLRDNYTESEWAWHLGHTDGYHNRRQPWGHSPQARDAYARGHKVGTDVRTGIEPF